MFCPALVLDLLIRRGRSAPRNAPAVDSPEARSPSRKAPWDLAKVSGSVSATKPAPEVPPRRPRMDKVRRAVSSARAPAISGSAPRRLGSDFHGELIGAAPGRRA
jgi:hypothetical protein